jgi:hypothetical protein
VGNKETAADDTPPIIGLADRLIATKRPGGGLPPGWSRPGWSSELASDTAAAIWSPQKQVADGGFPGPWAGQHPPLPLSGGGPDRLLSPQAALLYHDDGRPPSDLYLPPPYGIRLPDLNSVPLRNGFPNFK